jgi:hypothetical protein
MGTSRADREKFVAAPREQDRFVADVSCQQFSIGKGVDGEAQCEVRTGCFRFGRAHNYLRLATEAISSAAASGAA